MRGRDARRRCRDWPSTSTMKHAGFAILVVGAVGVLLAVLLYSFLSPEEWPIPESPPRQGVT